MTRRISFAIIALFWVVMNALLWRSEFGSGQTLGAKVPVLLVWEKILTAPDDSSLSINFQGKKLGYLRIRPNVKSSAGGRVENESEPEGIVRRVAEYTLDVEGSLVAHTIARSVRVYGEFAFDTAFAWKRLRAETIIKPQTWEIKGSAVEKAFWFQSADGESEWIRRFSFDDLRQPGKLLREIDSPLASAILPQLATLQSASNAPISLALNWEARFEWLTIGRNKVRIYRLEARLLDRHRVVVLVSRVGEILRVELPGDVKLINDILYAT